MLRVIAYSLSALAWVVIIAGVTVSIIIGIGAATVLTRIGFVVAGFMATAVYALLLLAASKLIYLLIDINDNLSQIVTLEKKKGKQ
jgi:hypothetical protein